MQFSPEIVQTPLETNYYFVVNPFDYFITISFATETIWENLLLSSYKNKIFHKILEFIYISIVA